MTTPPTTTKTRPPEYLIRLQAPGPDGPIRLRQLLKVALRRFGLRCVRVVEIEPHFAAEAEKRMLAGVKADPTGQSTVRTERHKQESSHQAASAVGVSGKTLSKAKALKAAAPEQFQEVVDGKTAPGRTLKENVPEALPQARDQAASAVGERAVRRLGELLKQTPKAQGKRTDLVPNGNQVDDTPTLAASAVTKKQSHFAAEAKKRQGQRTDIVGHSPTKSEKSRDQAASAIAISAEHQEPTP